jgi:hypothetical protein
MLTRLAPLLALLCLSTYVSAHPVPFSFLDIYLDTNGAHGTLVVHDFDVAHELGDPKGDRFISSNTAATEESRKQWSIATDQSRNKSVPEVSPRAMFCNQSVAT